MAASFAMVNHRPPQPGGFADVPVYAPGSPEDNRLRAHTRYLVEDKHAAAIGVLGIVYGLVINLLPIIAGLLVTGTLLGWTLRAARVLELNAARTAWEARQAQPVLLAAAAIALLGLCCFALDRWIDGAGHPSPTRSMLLQRASLRLFLLAAAVLVLFLVIPALLATASADTAGRIRSVPGSSIATGFLGSAGVIVGLVKATLGRFKGKLQATTSPPSRNPVAIVVGRVLRMLAPWAGSGIAAGLLLVALLVWVNNAAYRGFTPGGAILCGLALVGMCLWQLCTDINRSSIHPYYKERLSSAFAVRRTDHGTAVAQQPADEPIRFSTYAEDKPMLVVCAAVNTDQAGVTPAGRGCAPFTFSPQWIGVSSGTMFSGESATLCDRAPSEAGATAPAGEDVPHGRLMVPTAEYEEIAGIPLVDLPAAVAVSGAAISPVMGRMTRAPLRLLLGLANVRLGLWLPNPLQLPATTTTTTATSKKARRWKRLKLQWQQPGLRALLTEILGGIRLDRRWVYVTDGGHYENLGLVEALRRGATEIVVLDASGDPPNSWSTFGEAMQTARTDLGVEISLDPSTMQAPKDSAGCAPTLAVAGSFSYPNGVPGTLYLCKLAMPADVSWDVHAWGGSHPNFPHDSTSQQLYGDREFEAYRRLGEVAAGMAVRLMPSSIGVTESPGPVASTVSITLPVSSTDPALTGVDRDPA